MVEDCTMRHEDSLSLFRPRNWIGTLVGPIHLFAACRVVVSAFRYLKQYPNALDDWEE